MYECGGPRAGRGRRSTRRVLARVASHARRRDGVRRGLAIVLVALLAALQDRCAPAVGGLEREPASGRCFFGVENSKGYAGDATVRELVKAIEAAAYKLPSMKQRVPLERLRVHAELRKLSTSERHLSLSRVRDIARAHDGQDEVEVAGGGARAVNRADRLVRHAWLVWSGTVRRSARLLVHFEVQMIVM